MIYIKSKFFVKTKPKYKLDIIFDPDSSENK